MSKKCFRRTTWVTLFLFMFSLFNVKPLKANTVDAATVPGVQADSIAVLVGDLMKDNDLGEDWQPGNLKGQLKEYKNGIYEESFKLKAKDNYEYKIAMNGTWDESYGVDGGEGNIKLSIKDDCVVTFRFDYKNKKVYDSVNNPDEFKSKAIVAGEMNKCFGGNEWDVTDSKFEMDYLGGGIYRKTFKVINPGTMQYKVSYNGAWNNGELSSNQEVTIPEGTDEVTFFSDYLGNVTETSVDNLNLNNNISLIGTVRSGNGDWDPSNKDFDMYNIDGDNVMYTLQLKKGDYEYKGIVNYSWDGGGIPSSGNAQLSLDSDKNVVFIADTKAGTIIDSVNNANDVAVTLGLKSKEVVVKSPVVNENGTITFKYKNPEATSVYLTSNVNEWSKNLSSMTKDEDGVWSVTLRIGDEAQDVEYKFIVDGNYILDPQNSDTKNENSYVKFNKYEGRPITIPGSLATAISGTTGTWNAADKALELDYVGNGKYKKTFENVRPGRYEYKVAVNYKWDPENYGANGVFYGENISIVIPSTMDLTFYYNDDSHKVVTSLDYKMLDISLINGDESLGKLTDEKLNGIYVGRFFLKKGNYNNLSLNIKGDEEKTVVLDNIKVNEDKYITFSYDPTTDICFNDASEEKINCNGIYFNSRLKEYKSNYGAISEGNTTKFSVKADKDMIKEGKMILTTPKGIEVLDMQKDGEFNDSSDRWSVEYTPKDIGNYAYYFVLSNGSDVKAYGDDDGYFGEGIAANLGDIKNYEFNVYEKDFKTPDWLKNGVIYQIYPDRFFNGDSNNDYSQKYARGNTPYEFIKDWYSYPKDPDLMLKEDYEYPKEANKGDSSAWSNDLYGGDLRGIEEKVQYLKSLGVTVLYLNPIGKSISSHRYDTTDYTKVDPQLGNMDDFVSLANTAHENGMHVILDGVYNHVSDDSVYFDRYGKYVAKGQPLGAYQYWSYVYDDVNNNGISLEDAENNAVKHFADMGITDLHYKDWFIINNSKIFETDSEGKETGNYVYGYEGWAGYDSMPVVQALNGSEYNVKTWADEVVDGKDSVARQWLRQGSNGWRLDVANEVSAETWRAFRKAVKEENSDNAIIGEIWTDASSYILGDMYDSVMNYRFRGAVLNFVKGKTDDNSTVTSAKDSINELEKMREQYPKEALEAMMNLMGSHDTQRVISALDGYQKSERGFAKEATDLAKAKMRLIPFLQMTYVGAPTIYYGDEIGMVGCDDPDNRRGFTWGKGNKELVEWYASLASIRKAYSCLRTGDVNVSEVPSDYEDDVISYTRIDSDNKALILCNRGEESEIEVTTPGIENGTKLYNILNKNEEYEVKDGKVKVKVGSLNGVILVDELKDVSFNKEALSDAYDSKNIVANRTVPATDAEILEKIKEADKGSVIYISNIEEGISLKVLEGIVSANKDLKLVIERENVKITIDDVKGLAELVRNQGLTDFNINLDKDEIHSDLITKLNPLEVISFKTNLKDNNLGSKVIVEVSMEGQNNKTVYCYDVMTAAKPELIGKGEVKDGIFSFKTESLNHFALLDKEIPKAALSPAGEDPKPTPGNPATTPEEGANNDDDDTMSNSTKTSDENNVPMIMLLACLAIVTIGGVEYSKKSKKIK